MTKYSLFAALLLLIISCNDDKKVEQIDFTAQNEEEILKYIADNNLTAQKSSTGLHYVIEELGTGQQPSENSDVTVAYKGFYLNKSVFDESDSEGISFNLQQVIKGWTEGITYFKEGGNGILLVPSHLGYGSFDTRGIPGGSVLVFEVSLISVN
ncbi:FKBP-type peptidyl-prolyl cis-trans isomerase [Maribacter sp. 2308TA10-17]|uniref:FKBP-type peptidyl-prolyl cis-trans isomerase n=1 Tax=Maribacter sp. 2308TA10-17 TaxID=3386276 RepID=UPI0039BD7AD6